MHYLPTTKQEMNTLRWPSLDIIIVTGDAYVDHPSFGASLIGRWLEYNGFRVGIIAQPDYTNTLDFKRLGKPNLFFGVTAGSLDSMVSNYTPNKRKRDTDSYSPSKTPFKRPDRATIVYSNRIREVFKDVPIVLGGIEASLRKLAHYDYWQDSIRRSILLDSRADMLVYGMGELQIVELAKRLKGKESISSINDIKGTCILRKNINFLEDFKTLPSLEEVKENKDKFIEAFKIFYRENDPIRGTTLVQKHANQYVIHLPPSKPLSHKELDLIYELPFINNYHPSYKKLGGVDALKTVRFSITSHRGCMANCSFCSIAVHQGKIIQSRSHSSIIRQAEKMSKDKDFKGTITDIGGPTANMYMAGCSLQKQRGSCLKKDCLTPSVCKNLKLGDKESIDLLRKVRNLAGLKHVFISTGVRYDLCLEDKKLQYLREICKHHISGQLKIAPEHVSDKVLRIMNKSSFDSYKKFLCEYDRINKSLNKKQYLTQYFIASHPGCTLNDMLELALFIKKLGYYLKQLQDFTPTPMTPSSCMYYTKKDIDGLKKIHVPDSKEERRMQRALMQFKNPKNYKYVTRALRVIGRNDLIGNSKECLISKKKKKLPINRLRSL